jgi:SnoaL-like domain
MSKDVVARYQAALSGGDLQTARGLLKEDLRFTGPFDTFQTADEYWKAIQGLWSIVESVDVKHVSSDGDQVVVLYDMVTNTPAGTQLVCEWYGVDGNKIAWIRALFDSAPFAFLRSASA